jgi:hypothetical protein
MKSSMKTIRAHYDGEQIRLDEPCQLTPDTQLIVVVGPSRPSDGESEEWMLLSLQALDAAYGEQEPEYSLDAVKEPNPDMREGDRF